MKTLFVLVIILIGLKNAFGQIEGNETLLPYRAPLLSNIELYIGPSLVYYSGAAFYDETGVRKIAVAAQLGFVHEFNSRFQLSSIIGYENKGSKNVSYSLNEDYNPPAVMKHVSDVTLNFLTLSMVGKYSFMKSRRLFVGAGPYIGYLLKIKHISKLWINGVFYGQSGARPDPDEDYRRVDFGLVLLFGGNIYHNKGFGSNVQLMFKAGMIEINQPMLAPIETNSLSLLFSLHRKRNQP